MTPIDTPRLERATSELLAALGLDLDSPGIADTPKRVAKKWAELLVGYHQTPADVLARDFPADGYDSLVILRGIDFTSFCEHHMLPFHGRADVAYLPGAEGRVVGISKLARLVDVFAKRLQIQERMTRQIADALVEHLKPEGAGVVVRAHHECLGCRGAKKANAQMVTSTMLGKFRTDPTLRAEVLVLMQEAR